MRVAEEREGGGEGRELGGEMIGDGGINESMGGLCRDTTTPTSPTSPPAPHLLPYRTVPVLMRSSQLCRSCMVTWTGGACTVLTPGTAGEKGRRGEEEGRKGEGGGQGRKGERGGQGRKGEEVREVSEDKKGRKGRNGQR